MLAKFLTAIVFAAGMFISAASAAGVGSVSYTATGNFDDVVFDLENAIIDEGLVIDYRGYVNDMLERTSDVASASTDGAKSPYADATYMHFCSAALTHAVVAADSENIAICPYVVFAYELHSEPGTVHVGYRRPIAGPSEATQAALADIEALLDKIVRAAAGE